MVVRRFFAVALATLFSLSALASEPVSDEHVSFVDATTPPPEVTISAIPMPAAVTEVLPPINPAAKLRAARKAVQAKEMLPLTLLTRTERHQLALLVTKHKTGDTPSQNADQDDEGEPDDDDLVLQQFYARPRVVKEKDRHDQDADAINLSDTARVRLLMARLKALEVHAMAQFNDDGAPLPEHIGDRLKLARTKALEAHRNKFS